MCARTPVEQAAACIAGMLVTASGSVSIMTAGALHLA